MNIAALSINRPIFITSIVILILASGLIAMKRIGVDLFPDVTIPVVVVSTVYPGAGPEEVEDQISRRLEDELSSISGLKRVSSYNYEGVSIVVAEFNLSTDIKYAEQQVRNHTDLVRNLLPTEAKDPVVNRIDPADQPIIRLALFADLTPGQLYDLADQVVKPELARVEDVGKVSILGGTKREIQIQLDRNQMNEYKVPAVAIANQLRSAGKNIPVGNLEQGSKDLSYRLDAQFRNLKDIETTLISFAGDLNGVQVKDLGRVVDTVQDVETLGYLYAPVQEAQASQGIFQKIQGLFTKKKANRIEGQRRPALFIDVYKRSGANTVAVADGTMKQMARLNEMIAGGAGKPSMTLVRDGARPIRLNIDDVSESIILGIILAVVVVYFFLGNLRSTIITGVALPNSLLGAFIIMYAMGFTINMMSLLALSLAVGLLVDDAIVVRENIFRKLEAGYGVREAAERGTNEVALAVIATSLTVISVFLPVGFLSGIVGQFFKQFGLTIVFAMIISLFDGLMVAPMLSAYFSGNLHAKKPVWIVWFDRFQDWQDSAYEKVLRYSIAHPLKIMGIASLVFVLSIGATILFVQQTFLPTGDQGEFMVTIELPPGTGIHTTAERALQMEERIRSMDDVELIATVIGSANGEKNKATLGIKLTPFKGRRITTTEFKVKVREMVNAEFADASPRVSDYGMVGGIQYPYVLNLSGQDLKVTEEYAAQLVQRLRNITDKQKHPVLSDLDSSSRPGRPDFKIRIDPMRAKQTGVNAATAGLEMRYQVAGEKVAVYNEKGVQYDVTVRAMPSQRNLGEAFHQLHVPNVQMRMIPLRAIATGKVEPSSAMIFRQDRGRVVQITANLAPGGALQTAMDESAAVLKKFPPPPGVSYRFVGQSEDMKELGINILVAFGLALLLIYLTLSSLYESFITPMTILVAIPPALSGALYALAVTGKTLDIFSMIGIIMLMGLVVKNSILLVDHAMQDIRNGMDQKTAIYQAGVARLRPILMTTIAMIAGIAPVALGIGEVAKFRASMGIAIIGGLIISTAMTLILVPAIFEYIDRFRVFVESRIGHKEPETVHGIPMQGGSAHAAPRSRRK